MQHGPDLVLARQQETVEVRGDERDFDEFVGVGKRGHRGAGEHGWLKAVAAG